MAIILKDISYDCFEKNITGNVTKGLVAQIQDVIGFWFNVATYVAGVANPVTFVYRAKQATFDKKIGTGMTISKGDKLFADPSDEYRVSATKNSGDKFVGWAHEDADGDDTTVDGRFDGTLHELL